MCRVNTLPPFCIAFEDFANWTRISILHLPSTAIDDGTCDDQKNYDDHGDIDDDDWIPRPSLLDPVSKLHPRWQFACRDPKLPAYCI